MNNLVMASRQSHGNLSRLAKDKGLLQPDLFNWCPACRRHVPMLYTKSIE